MAVFTVDSDAVLTQSAQVQATVERLRAETQAMLSQLMQLQSAWTGQASSAFHGAVEQWRPAQRHVEEALGAITLALGAAGRQYADAEQANLALFR
ncbi:WXG100 family type VII secretion target [uncultured Microbacterium sp.]|jgi:6 kDa early secretory antigenic target|uniref:WXG100 family type VII secretion target n=1 Tax=uncultured Microbacterium sp. TaxID=191216 RepID=UPI0025EB2C8C|nr:WXG100 family type VII secretion target [uncultured Microbacterium sp.]